MKKTFELQKPMPLKLFEFLQFMIDTFLVKLTQLEKNESMLIFHSAGYIPQTTGVNQKH